MSCVLCPPRFPNGWTVLRELENWTLIENPRPLAGTRHHLTLVPKQHVDDVLDLPPAAFVEWWDALRWAQSHFELAFYCLGMRCGEGDHVHTHMVVGEVDDPEHEKVRFPLTGAKEGLYP